VEGRERIRVVVPGDDDLEHCFAVRREVFIEGQGIDEREEMDGRDGECLHLLAVGGRGEAVGTVRLRVVDGLAKLERLAVREPWRGRGVGARLVEAFEREARARGLGAVLLGSQVEAIGFYEACGYRLEGDPFLDAGIPHRWMRKVLSRRRCVAAWSSGKDAAHALAAAREDPEIEVVGVLTTVTETFSRVSMHGTREEILDMQGRALGLPVHKARIPFPCPDREYERVMEGLLESLGEGGVDHVIFGDLFLEDVRAYRERNLERAGMRALFPLWGRPTRELAEEMIASGIRAVLTCVDPRVMDPGAAGRSYDRGLVASLGDSVDPCGENGEFHTLVTDAPVLASPIGVRPGEVVEREGFLYADFLPEVAGASRD